MTSCRHTAGEMAVKIDIHSVGQPNDFPMLSVKGAQPNGSSGAQVPARMPAPSAKAKHTNGITNKAAPARGKPGVPKTSQKKDPAELQRERQLAEEQEVLDTFSRHTPELHFYSYLDRPDLIRPGAQFWPHLWVL